MLKKGTMIPAKKAIGIAMVVMAAGFMFNIAAIKDVVMDNIIISSIVMLSAGYLLFISGRQR